MKTVKRSKIKNQLLLLILILALPAACNGKTPETKSNKKTEGTQLTYTLPAPKTDGNTSIGYY